VLNNDGNPARHATVAQPESEMRSADGSIIRVGTDAFNGATAACTTDTTKEIDQVVGKTDVPPLTLKEPAMPSDTGRGVKSEGNEVQKSPTSDRITSDNSEEKTLNGLPAVRDGRPSKKGLSLLGNPLGTPTKDQYQQFVKEIMDDPDSNSTSSKSSARLSVEGGLVVASLASTPQADGLFVTTAIGPEGVIQPAFIDQGACVSVMSEDLVKRANLPVYQTEATCYTADGTDMQCSGFIDTKVDFIDFARMTLDRLSSLEEKHNGEETTEASVANADEWPKEWHPYIHTTTIRALVVKQLPYQLIIGRDFLRRHRFNLRMHEDSQCESFDMNI
jgi:hypothetical protein